MSTDFLSLVLKHLIVHSCSAPCTTVVHDFLLLRLASSVFISVSEFMGFSRRCSLSVVVLWCRPVSHPVPVVI